MDLLISRFGVLPGGTRDAEPYVDILLLNGHGRNYPDAANYYVRIEKAHLTF